MNGLRLGYGLKVRFARIAEPLAKSGVKRGVVKMEGPKCRPGLYQCNACREQFTVTVGTVMERSKIGLHIWLKAMYLLGASKKGMSTHQLHRMLGVSLKSTWFLMHRIREAMREPYFGKFGIGGGSVQADETYVGKTTMRNREWYQRGYVVKEKVLTLVADGKGRSTSNRPGTAHYGVRGNRYRTESYHARSLE